MKQRFHRLYFRIYVAVLASLLITAILIATAWRFAFDPARHEAQLDTFSEIASEVLPPPTAPISAQQAALDRWHHRSHSDLGLFTDTGALIASAATTPLPAPDTNKLQSVWLFGQHGPPAFALKLNDGRWLVARRVHGRGRAPFGFVATLALIAFAVGIGAYPVVRRLTRRLERLQGGVEALGAGNLAVRVPVAGHDEVAQLAAAFNSAAARIQSLIQAQKNLLANASHELRSPLARMRMSVEMLKENPNAETRREIEQNIRELDQLIDEILLASRLDATHTEQANFEIVDLTALVAEECARGDALLEGELLSINGDAKLLRRMARNLLENAHRYGGGSPVEVTLRGREENSIVLEVCDRGPGVPESEREKIFEPFYRLPGTRERDGGVGLGLALAQQIARKHSGAITCRGRDGGGSCFSVMLRAA
ncbi:MAG: HAMP domain-containing sensor histidine kinase [Burkholderiales bacterium]